MRDSGETQPGRVFYPGGLGSYVKKMQDDPRFLVREVAQSVEAGSYRRKQAPEWPGSIDMPPSELMRAMERAGKRNPDIKEMASEFGAWRDQVLGVEARNFGTIVLLSDCLAKCGGESGQASVIADLLKVDYVTPDKAERLQAFNMPYPFVEPDKMKRQKWARVVSLDIIVMPNWLRAGTAPTASPSRPAGYRDVPPEDVL